MGMTLLLGHGFERSSNDVAEVVCNEHHMKILSTVACGAKLIICKQPMFMDG